MNHCYNENPTDSRIKWHMKAYNFNIKIKLKQITDESISFTLHWKGEKNNTFKSMERNLS